MSTEIWKDIPGYEGEYQASTEGRIRSVDHYVNHSKGGKRLIKGRILKPGKYCKSGHLSVVLRRGTNGQPVHRLVMLTFVGPSPKGKEVCHINGDPTDNRLDNLRYDTRTQNIIDVYRQGRAWRKLNAQQVRQIRKDLQRGNSCTEIAKQYNMSVNAISRIKNRRTFGWLK